MTYTGAENNKKEQCTQALLLFIKNPILGQVKTRLAKTIGDDSALSVYQNLLQICYQNTRFLTQADKYLYYSHFVEEKDIWTAGDYYKTMQSEGSLGDRMKIAFQQAQKTYESALIIGSDCPAISTTLLQEALDALHSFDLVIGPANDGGYYLLGMRSESAYLKLFDEVDWSTDRVLAQTLSKASKLGMTILLLEELVDVDDAADLQYYIDRHGEAFLGL